jgi:hypothetical protein
MRSGKRYVAVPQTMSEHCLSHYHPSWGKRQRTPARVAVAERDRQTALDSPALSLIPFIIPYPFHTLTPSRLRRMSLRTADDSVTPGSADGHGIVGSPTATNGGPHPYQSHPAQPPISASTAATHQTSTIPSRPSLSSKSSSSPPRSSTDVDFVGKSSPSATARWRSSIAATQRTDVTSSAQSDSTTVVEPGFDESVLRALCDLDVSVMPSRLFTTLNQRPFPHQVRGAFIT